MKKISVFWVVMAFVIFLMSETAFASPIPIVVDDNYVGADDHNLGDVIGDVNKFGISKAEFTLVGETLTVDVYTSFAGHGDDGWFAADTVGNKGLGYGDLLLSGSWSPYGSQPYLLDNHATGTLWKYGLSLDDRWSATGGSAALYELNGSTNDANLSLTENFMTGATFRNGQEVAVDRTSNSVRPLSNAVSWSIYSDHVSFILNIGGTNLADADEIAFHWGSATCGNDVIEGKVNAPVPEPETMLLLGTGLIGLAGLGRRKLLKK